MFPDLIDKEVARFTITQLTGSLALIKKTVEQLSETYGETAEVKYIPNFGELYISVVKVKLATKDEQESEVAAESEFKARMDYLKGRTL